MSRLKEIVQALASLRPVLASSTDTKGHMVTVLTATEKDVSYRKACGAIGWVGLREFLRLHNEVSE
ncbi:Uncharacterised protein [Klebsiella michiganensis]|uniref:Uncharacterized protein n=1 Tax=Klebsiella michiganensis TaxID=1134687 RepID=A0A7H4LWK4_9ENTR|nr:Uncharacterised protein [Klebsiella michiganensis]